MVKIKSIQIRLTNSQYEKIKQDAFNKGFGNISNYMRFLALHRDNVLARKIVEIHDSVVDKATRRQERNENEQLRNSL